MRRRLAGRAIGLALATGLVACGGRTDHEALGDRAYGEARYADAIAEYLEASRQGRRPDVWAKLGAAALHAGELRQSTEAYLKLAELDQARRAEAAEGLDGVARAAERTDNADVLQEAVTGLTAVDPGRSTSRFALTLARRADADTTSRSRSLGTHACPRCLTTRLSAHRAFPSETTSRGIRRVWRNR